MLKSIFTRTTTRRARRRLTRNPGLVGGRPIAATPGKWEISRDMIHHVPSNVKKFSYICRRKKRNYGT